jgi:23S rRNA (uracil1939-C5)-methyltransferase
MNPPIDEQLAGNIPQRQGIIGGIVTAIGNAGDGIMLVNGKKTFVPFALPGESIQNNSPINPSPDRVEPPCPHHGKLGRLGCGGCRMQHLDMTAYAEWKRSLVIRALERASIEYPSVEPLHISPIRSRRRAALTAERRGGRLRIGFNRRGTHDVVDLSACLVLMPALFALLEPMRLLPLLREGERADILLTRMSDATDMLIERRRDLDLGEREALAAFGDNHDIARIAWRAGPRQEAEPVCHRAPFMAVFGGYPVPLAPAAFLQATGEGEATLVSILRQSLRPECRTIDLFAGNGTFTFPAQAHGPVHAVEIDPDACKSIRAAGAPGVTIERRNLFSDPVTDFTAYDAAIIDPPYAGAEAQAGMLAGSGPATIVSVSCNPISFARDTALLVRAGYQLERIVPVDQFLWSADVEIGAVLHRNG